jgi:hypothetical protein
MTIYLSDAGEMAKGSPFYDVKKITSHELITLDGIPILKADVEPTVEGRSYGFGDFNPTTVYFADHSVSPTGDDSIRTLRKFPIQTRAYLATSQDGEVKSMGDLKMASWVTLYDSKESALRDIAEIENARAK